MAWPAFLFGLCGIGIGDTWIPRWRLGGTVLAALPRSLGLAGWNGSPGQASDDVTLKLEKNSGLGSGFGGPGFPLRANRGGSQGRDARGVESPETDTRRSWGPQSW